MTTKEKFISLKNTLGLIETKGENTLIMTDCIKFISWCIQECDQQERDQQECDQQERDQTKPLPEVEAMPAVNK